MNRIQNFESEERESLLTAYALGELDENERTQVESWLATSPAARAQLEEVRQLNTALLAARQGVQLSPRSACLRLDVLGKLAEQQGEPLPGPVAPAAAMSNPSVLPRLTALAAALLVAGGLAWALAAGGQIDPAQERIAHQLNRYDTFMQEGRYEEALIVAQQVDRQVTESHLESDTLNQLLDKHISPATNDLLASTDQVHGTGSVDFHNAFSESIEKRTLRALENELARLEGSPVDGGASAITPEMALEDATAHEHLSQLLAQQELNGHWQRVGGNPYELTWKPHNSIGLPSPLLNSEQSAPHVGPSLRYTPTIGGFLAEYRSDQSSFSFQGASSYPSGTTAIDPADRFTGAEAFPAPGMPIIPGSSEGQSVETYDNRVENAWLTPLAAPLSTFSADVDTASYANVRRFLTESQLPPTAAVRVEEFINYFHYNYAPPAEEAQDEDAPAPFAVHMEVAACPWNPEHQLVRIGLRGREVPLHDRPASNLVFLIDVSGSMGNPDKLTLVKEAMLLLAAELNENDSVTIVTYAGDAGLRLPPTNGSEQETIQQAIESLQSGGSTYGSAGIELAYNMAVEQYLPEGTNRVIWATDGDLNVGVTGDEELIELVSKRAEEGVFLTVLGVGRGNLQDAKLEGIANNGNGHYAYLDSLYEAQKVLVHDMSGTLITIAQDVKLQVEFNPEQVAAYRLIGYENRLLAVEDFDDDTKDAGEIGAGHTVTALYEIISPETSEDAQSVSADDSQGAAELPPLRYQIPAAAELTEAAGSDELLVLALRYKEPTGTVSRRLEYTLAANDTSFAQASEDFRFAAAAASFAMLLRQSEYAGSATFASVEEYATGATGDNVDRLEFLRLVQQAGVLSFEGIRGTQEAPAEEPGQ